MTLSALLLAGFPHPYELSTGLSTAAFTTYKHVVSRLFANINELSHIQQVLIVVIKEGLNSWESWVKPRL
jgi:hypothetical protein